jgi:hypothetical protein
VRPVVVLEEEPNVTTNAQKAAAAAKKAEEEAAKAQQAAKDAGAVTTHTTVADVTAVQQADLAAADAGTVEATDTQRAATLGNVQQEQNVLDRQANPHADHTGDATQDEPEFTKPSVEDEFPTDWHRQRYCADLEREIEGRKAADDEAGQKKAEAELKRVRGGSKQTRPRGAGAETR